jgi:TolB-like protein/DNA-binding winged helix-turn-helix (wHTH) protein/Flp pilus assembly protein TadD
MLLAPVRTRSARPAISRYRFGTYEVDAARNELRKSGLRVKLERKPLQLLIDLLDRAGEVVTRTDLQHSLWDDGVFVDFEKGLTVAVTKLRAVLNDSSENPTYIQTVAGEGYRFIAKVEQDPLSSSLMSLAGDSRESAVLPPTPVACQVQVPAFKSRESVLWKRKAQSAAAIVVCVAVFVMGGATLARRKMAHLQAVQTAKIMLVVLPFENLSNDPNQEYFSDGMTEELSAQLGNQDPHRLGVIGRTSAMTYKHSNRTIRDIGRDLAVDYVLEGSVRRDGSQVRITAQLVQVSDQAHVWAHNYDEDMRDLLRLESDLAGEIARQVGVSIAIGQAKKSLQPHIPSPEAHEAYLLGRYNWNKRTTAGWKIGEEYFRRAIKQDPQYAAPYAGLAECRIPIREARAAALKAIALDPTSGEAHTALGFVQLFRFLDPAAAEPALRQAIELAPNYAQAHYWYGGYLAMVGHLYDAINEGRQAILLDPLSPLFRSGLAGYLSEAGQVDEAVKQLQAVFEMDPQFAVAHESLGLIFAREGKYKEAIEEFQTKARLGGDPNLSAIAYSYALWGKKMEALKMLSQLQRSGGVPAEMAVIDLGLGDKEKALAWLEKTYEDHEDDALLYLKEDPIYDPLRSDPRFQSILRRMNFPP